MHEHMMFRLPSPIQMINGDDRYNAIVSTMASKKYLDRGITTVRDVGGNSFGLKQAIDEGLVPGPRIFPSGPMLSQTSGHGDLRPPTNPSTFAGGEQSEMVARGDLVVVDGVPEVLRAARENLRRGASQIKIAVGGGTVSRPTPWRLSNSPRTRFATLFRSPRILEPMSLSHLYDTKRNRRAIDNGVKSIEHANLIDRETLQYMKDNDVWLSPQITVYTFIPGGFTEDQAAKHRQAYAGIDWMFKAAKEIRFENIVVGSDIITAQTKDQTPFWTN